MKRIMILGVALLAIFGVVAVDAVSVSASGDEFYASKTAKTKSKETNGQIFKTGAGTLECSTVKGTGEMKEGGQVSHKEVFTYSGCTAFGTRATMTAADFEFNANGPVKLENTVTISVGGGECEIELEPQTVERAAYTNKSGGKIEAEANAFKIHSKGSGSYCGGNNTEGSYTGSILGEMEGGGTIEWKS
jgi:hypothetical protein